MKKFNIKSQKGITMVSLIIYIASFLVVTSIVGFITTFFYNNVANINNDLGATAYYNAFNSFMLAEVNKPGVKIKIKPGTTDTELIGVTAIINVDGTVAYGDGGGSSQLIVGPEAGRVSYLNCTTFTTQSVDGSDNQVLDYLVYDMSNHVLYFNTYVIARNVTNFTIKKHTDSSGKEFINAILEINNNKTFKTNYVLNNYNY